LKGMSGSRHENRKRFPPASLKIPPLKHHCNKVAHSDKPSVDEVPSPWWSERILAPARLGWRRRLNNPFRDFDASPDVIRMFVMTHVRFPFSLRKLKMSSPRSLRLVGRFGTTRPFAVSTARVDVDRTLRPHQKVRITCVASGFDQCLSTTAQSKLQVGRHLKNAG
jgi:hypothetical protein